MDEIIEIVRLKTSGMADEITSNIEFADCWLEELGIKYRNVAV